MIDESIKTGQIQNERQSMQKSNNAKSHSDAIRSNTEKFFMKEEGTH
jgi:hypothetical protein